ncbi:DUF6069 family protein [Promicromonospora sp. NPDC060271]|uniref:DUF6069 family protein n=1 Tax=Promicromonospora sp. NPDC060271 TaxID=3347089 RepID=UPI003667EFC4
MTESSATSSSWPAWAVPFAAAAVAVVVWLVGAASDVNLEARLGTDVQAVSVVAAAVAALAAGFAGWGARALIARVVRRGDEVVWFVLCGAVLLASMVGALAGTTPGAVSTLVSMHVAVGAVIALGLRAARNS